MFSHFKPKTLQDSEADAGLKDLEAPTGNFGDSHVLANRTFSAIEGFKGLMVFHGV